MKAREYNLLPELDISEQLIHEGLFPLFLRYPATVEIGSCFYYCAHLKRSDIITN